MPIALFDTAHTTTLLNDLRRANTEQAKKERFLQYISVMFSGDAAAQALISSQALGAERMIANIPRAGGSGLGRADTQTETVIIEWERDLARTGDHARHQLEEYLTGNWRSGETYRFVLIATDGIRWRRYAPDWESMDEVRAGRRSAIELREVARFDLAPASIADFPFFLDELLFGSEARPATLSRVQADFGDTSAVFINSVTTLRDVAGNIEVQSELKVAFEEWQRFLSIAYGRFDSSPDMFLVHTYLSVFAKFIAHAVLTARPLTDTPSIKAVLDGSAFRSLNIERFVEDDFFHWVHAEDYLTALRPMFREISRKIQEYDFSNVSEDVLKGVYQELIDLDTRHALGEYYTPDWLCELIMNGVAMRADSRVLDPACGSGSFLRAAVAKLRADHSDIDAEALAHQVVGIDIHPLSVQIAKTTLLLAMADLVRAAARPVTLQVFLANSLLVPQGTANLFETTFTVAIDNEHYTIDVRGLDGSEAFDGLITMCDELAARYQDPLSRNRFLSLVENAIPAGTASSLPGELFGIYTAMKAARDSGRDSIWKFILQNSYKPVFLMNRFDIVVGNPPWLTYASVASADYQRLLRLLADGYEVTPEARANIPHLEIAAIFLAHSANYFLARQGQLAFVLPRAMLTADQHHNTRAGVVSGLKLTGVWDLKDVHPLFRVPSCVLFARFSNDGRSSRSIPEAGVGGRVVSGRLPASQVSYATAMARLTVTDQQWFYSVLSSSTRRRVRSALTRTPAQALDGSNAYERRFKQGATIVPRNFYFFDVDQPLEGEAPLSERTLSIRTSEAAEGEAKGVWRGKVVTGRAEGTLFYRTAISRNVLPFCLIDPPLVLLPITTLGQGRDERYELLTPEDLFSRGLRHASAWFTEVERLFEANKTEAYKRNGTTFLRRLDFQQGIKAQEPNDELLVLYTGSATDASAVLINRRDFDCPFIVEHKTYWCKVRSHDEGHYLTAFINSNYANEAIKDFQSQGLFGERDIHKLIVKVPFPRFDPRNQQHLDLAVAGKRCAQIASTLASEQQFESLAPRALGRARTQIRNRLVQEMELIDRTVEQLSTGELQLAKQPQRRRRRRGHAGPDLFEAAAE